MMLLGVKSWRADGFGADTVSFSRYLLRAYSALVHRTDSSGVRGDINLSGSGEHDTLKKI